MAWCTVRDARALLRTPCLWAAVSIAAVSLIAGCSSSSDSAPSSSPTAASQPVDESLAAKSGEEILEAARAAAGSAESFRVTGSRSNGEQTSVLDFTFTPDGSKGTLQSGDGTMQIVATGGKIYIRGDEEWNSANAGSAGQELLNEKWIDITDMGGGNEGLEGYENARKYLDTVLVTGGDVAVGERTEVNGIPAIRLQAPAGQVDVALAGEPYPLRVTGAEGGVGDLMFSDWNADVTIEAPPSQEIFDMSQIQQ